MNGRKKGGLSGNLALVAIIQMNTKKDQQFIGLEFINGGV
jgi:hypothetical protein